MTSPPSPSRVLPLQILVQDLVGFVQARSPALTDASQGSPASTAVLLDVREAWELQAARFDLPGARSLHIPMGALPARWHELDRLQPVLVLCHHGARSLQCVAYLQRQGFESVYNVAGGIDAWSCEVDSTVPRY